ncbi:ATP synthase F0 subcomplex A subunit [Caminicella sporogenes DSM 14501]|uniref:ATP synthase subunit a n=1 Tax=Caminicella sporogenes DSM 14501 TaxID=1121266 RepID=A0A1M6PTL6_9FIRM|nr:F0F1 ATP synthase subunit A [Caminicella sporogenes]RKD21981.1 ATP synthase F0 subunit A [Caminicella sporogenes]SHK11287.1 ATP synthase F0 subcomplex A subunit [Caminicella sporogenes DSM 14501]
MEGFGPRVVFTIPGTNIAVTETVTVTWFIMGLLALFSYFATRHFDKVPKKFQNFVEVLVEAVYNLTRQTMGENKMSFAPYMGTILIFLAIANIAGLFGLRPPTADVNTTLGLATITFFMIHLSGIKSKGIGGYLKGFLEPFPLLLPLNVIGELATPISLGFRLFGNIVGGFIIMNLLYGALGALSAKLGIMVPIFQAGIPAPLHIYFDLFAGILQSFIFTMLTMVFVAMAMD